MGASFLVPKSSDHCQIGPRSAPGLFMFGTYQFLKILFLNGQQITVSDLILFNASSFISVAFLVIIQPSDGVTYLTT